MTPSAKSDAWSQRWQTTWHLLNLSPPASKWFDELLDHYQEAHRHYHTLQHLDECFTVLHALRPTLIHPGKFELALWCHDVIYNVTQSDNVERSADWTCDCLRDCGAGIEVIERVYNLVMATKHHVPSEAEDANVLVDLDLSILGAAPDRFREYDAQIRAEYKHVPDVIFFDRRRQILSGFLSRPRIYNAELFFDRYEEQARENLIQACTDNALS